MSLPDLPDIDVMAESEARIGPWHLGLRVYSHYRLSAGKHRQRIVAVAFPLSAPFPPIDTIVAKLLPIVRERYMAEERLVVYHLPRSRPVWSIFGGRFDRRGRALYLNGESWWQGWATGRGPQDRPLVRLERIDRRAVEFMTGSHWRPVVDGVTCDEVVAEQMALYEREARMLQGDRTAIEQMRPIIEARGHHFASATARPGNPGWFHTETRDRVGNLHVASGVSIGAWQEDFLGVSACPEYPFAPGAGVTMLHQTKPVACTVAEVKNEGRDLLIVRDRAIVVSGDKHNPVYRFEFDGRGETYVARWVPERLQYMAFIVSGLPVALAHGRFNHYEEFVS